MNSTERHRHILSPLKKEGSLHVIDRCNALEVSSVIIRKDLKMLEDFQLLFRINKTSGQTPGVFV